MYFSLFVVCWFGFGALLLRLGQNTTRFNNVSHNNFYFCSVFVCFIFRTKNPTTCTDVRTHTDMYNFSLRFYFCILSAAHAHTTQYSFHFYNPSHATSVTSLTSLPLVLFAHFDISLIRHHSPLHNYFKINFSIKIVAFLIHKSFTSCFSSFIHSLCVCLSRVHHSPK